MRRIECIELHDHPLCPAWLRNLVTDALQELWRFGNSYRPILPRLYSGLAASSSTVPAEVLDLCSGAGGPWPCLSRQLNSDYQLPVRVSLTDKYPNREALEQARDRAHSPINPQTMDQAHLDFVPQSVDAICVPATLGGFRTIFSSFHHFGPADAREVLHNAVAHNRGIGIFEIAQRSPKTILVLCFIPLLVLAFTPRIRPFRWSRFFWTYIVPVVPFVIWFDGLISCLRAYAPEEIDEMIQELAHSHVGQHYRWQSGEERTGFLPVTYLIGYPVTRRLSDSVSI